MFRNKRWYPMMLALFLAAGIGAAGYAAGQRYYLEAGDRKVEVAIPYGEVQRLAGLAGKQPVEVMKLFREKGLTAVFFKEPTVEQVEGEFAVLSGQELFFFSRAGGGPSWLRDLLKQGKINPGDTCFVTREESSAQRLAGQLQIKAANANLHVYTGPAEGNNASGEGADLFVVCTSAGLNALADLGLGFPAGPLTESRLAGLNAVVQIRNWPGVTARSLEQVFKPLEDIPNLSAIAFDGSSVPGYPKLLPALSKAVQNLGVPIVQIEFHPQNGLAGLGMLLNKRILRLHSADPEEIKVRSFGALQSRLVLAAAERNVRILLVYPLVAPGSGDPLAENLQYIAVLKEGLEEKGLLTGSVRPLPPLAQPGWLLFLMGLGVIAGGLGMLWQAGIVRCNPLLGLVSVACWAGLLSGAPQVGCKLLALAAAIVFPVFSIQAHVKSSGETISKSILLFLRTTLLSLAGALFVAGLLADTRYMLKLDQFTGVKVAYIFPLLLLTAVFVWRSKTRDAWEYAVRLLNQPVLFKWVLAGVLLLVVLAVYLIRTGSQEIIPPPALELKIRSVLEHLLAVRPRTKEFLIGHPFLLLLYSAGYRDYRFLPFLLLGAIGQISIINTFIHVHTPLAVSAFRMFHGLWLGILAGLILIFLWYLVFRGAKKFFLDRESRK